jgi:peptidoglycan-N-acetylglucosamine deacetylase
MSSMNESAIAPCPVVVSVNVDVESRDAVAAGASGLYGRYSYGRYGAREGLWRILEAFKREDIRATFFFDVDDASRHRNLVETVLAAGHEAAPQSIVVTDVDRRGPAKLESLSAAVDLWKKVTGAAPAGWRSGNGLITPDTMSELARLGYSYDSSFEDDDRPYAFALETGRLIELPVFKYLTDAPFYEARHTPARVSKAWTEEADALHAIGGYVNLTLHLRGDCGSTRPPRVTVVSELVKYLKAKAGTQFYRCDELSDLLQKSQIPAESIPAYPMTFPAHAL